MANIINISFFYGQLEIAQITELSVQATLNRYIDTLEQDFLKDLFGYGLSKLFLAGYSTPGIYKDLLDGVEYVNRFGQQDKFKGLVFKDGEGEKKRSMIANFIYYHYLRQETTFTSGSGEKEIATQNAVNASNRMKQTRAWNEMVKWVKELWEFLYVKQQDYPEYFNNGRQIYATHPDLMTVNNSMNL
jgi:hypothetical protein